MTLDIFVYLYICISVSIKNIFVNVQWRNWSSLIQDLLWKLIYDLTHAEAPATLKRQLLDSEAVFNFKSQSANIIPADVQTT